jgi:hypothetical protein
MTTISKFLKPQIPKHKPKKVVLLEPGQIAIICQPETLQIIEHGLTDADTWFGTGHYEIFKEESTIIKN